MTGDPSTRFAPSRLHRDFTSLAQDDKSTLMLTLSYENSLKRDGHATIAGVDEAGRGPLAGPVVAAAVVFDRTRIPRDLRALADSKKLTARAREELYPAIIEHAAGVGIAAVDNRTIDRINILQAAFRAMHESLKKLPTPPDMLLIDGNLPLPNYTGAQQSIVRGDANVFSIAAASVLAKVARDRYMVQAHEHYPHYFFNKHKGYGTKLHQQTLKLYGPCELHRHSFAPITSLLNSKS